jgi:hypothetical protein
MMDKHKAYDQTSDPRPGCSPLPGGVEIVRKQKTRIELEENEDLEKDEGTEATRGSPESPDNTGGERKAVKQESEFDDAREDDAANPAAIDEKMRNEDS